MGEGSGNIYILSKLIDEPVIRGDIYLNLASNRR